ncbi:response regulator transcription factor [Mucilaginibacter psychrotolerans]|uniref:Response regulator transcription factor n=1 Tax=Mucilaginibacter psychrotolerans TaxID=1524096 RepID=A0A4Y8S3V4_9SPHI|nr:response regulator transcription factor [Mucilaginibacter psychrotolerans]TFF33371.1 response regulator transcription factor [Mucilaginibacter psychrotolerans]
MNIAIVDDHVLFRRSLKVLIELFSGYKVTHDASHGQDLIRQLTPANLPDIVLMDINMPVMDGYATTHWLRNNHPAIKVLALSTMDAEAAIIKMIKSGACGYVLKDAEPAELRMAFEEVMSRGYFYNELVTRKVMRSVGLLADANGSVGTFANLTERELELLKYICTELTYKEIADKMFLSARTVEGYRDNLCEKLNLKSRVGLAMYAIKNQIVTSY